MRELVVGYGLYAVEHHGNLIFGSPANRSEVPPNTDIAWLRGPGTGPILDADLYTYANDLELHNCPSDPNGLPRSYVITSPPNTAETDHVRGTKNINGVSNVSGQIVFVEESDSRGWNIGSFIIEVRAGRPAEWIDCPAALHFDTTTDNYAFLDGHVESRTWVTSQVLYYARLGKQGIWNHYLRVPPTNADWLWFRPRFRAMPAAYNSKGAVVVAYMPIDADA